MLTMGSFQNVDSKHERGNEMGEPAHTASASGLPAAKRLQYEISSVWCTMYREPLVNSKRKCSETVTDI